MGARQMFIRIPSRLFSLASMAGVEIPAVDKNMIQST